METLESYELLSRTRVESSPGKILERMGSDNSAFVRARGMELPATEIDSSEALVFDEVRIHRENGTVRSYMNDRGETFIEYYA